MRQLLRREGGVPQLGQLTAWDFDTWWRQKAEKREREVKRWKKEGSVTERQHCWLINEWKVGEWIRLLSDMAHTSSEVCLSVYLSVCPSVCVCLFVGHVWMAEYSGVHWELTKKWMILQCTGHRLNAFKLHWGAFQCSQSGAKLCSIAPCTSSCWWT